MLEGVDLTGADISFIRCSTTSSLEEIDGSGEKMAACVFLRADSS